jgi:hypothetical protein
MNRRRCRAYPSPMGFLDRFRDKTPEPTIDEDGFVHAPDAAPEDVVAPPREPGISSGRVVGEEAGFLADGGFHGV